MKNAKYQKYILMNWNLSLESTLQSCCCESSAWVRWYSLTSKSRESKQLTSALTILN